MRGIIRQGEVGPGLSVGEFRNFVTGVTALSVRFSKLGGRIGRVGNTDAFASALCPLRICPVHAHRDQRLRRHVGPQGVRLWKVALLLVLAIAAALLMERVLPYEARWNTSHGDAGKDAAHGFVYELSSLGGLVWLQLIAWAVPWQGIWPREWPLGIQLLAAIIIADLGATLVHYASHRIDWLWSLHCVHHGVHRLYGFNGLVRHPLHQQIDLAVAVLPLVLLGMPLAVTVLLGLAISVQLILQHANVDYRLGLFRHVLSIGPTHRLHHVNWAGEGDVNFGLFFTFWDRALGTFRASSQRAPAAGDIGLQDQPSYPQRYWDQLTLPFARTR
jgi:sterol desaturase/sphingolipid hydroxylase (fatty acid hydroxylase superfamily)